MGGLSTNDVEFVSFCSPASIVKNKHVRYNEPCDKREDRLMLLQPK